MSTPRARNGRDTAARPRRKADSQVKTVAGLGAKLKSAREHSGVSVRGLARSLEVSPSLVSQIERGLVTPSVGTLHAMVTELGIGLDELFEPSKKSGATARAATAAESAPGPVRRAKNREAIRLADGVRWELLTPATDPYLEFLYVAYEPGAESCEADSLVRHGGMEYAYVISGRLGIRIGFDEYELRAGDSISFDAQKPHRLWTIGNRPVVAIWAILNRHSDRRKPMTGWKVKAGVNGAGDRSRSGRRTRG